MILGMTLYIGVKMRYFTIIAVLLLLRCSTTYFQKSGFNDLSVVSKALEYAISDFSERNFWGSKDSTFSVTAKVIDEDVIAISLSGSMGKIVVTPEPGYEAIWANQYIEKVGRLFYWRDENIKKNPQIISKLIEFDLIEYVESISEVELTNDHAKKSYDYFFCKKDLSTFKRFKSRQLVGDYPTPRLRCPENR